MDTTFLMGLLLKLEIKMDRYRGITHVNCRRAQKGFQLENNLDAHWSNTLYKGLNERYKLNINHDDAAGFCLDTMAMT